MESAHESKSGELRQASPGKGHMLGCRQGEKIRLIARHEEVGRVCAELETVLSHWTGMCICFPAQAGHRIHSVATGYL